MRKQWQCDMEASNPRNCSFPRETLLEKTNGQNTLSFSYLFHREKGGLHGIDHHYLKMRLETVFGFGIRNGERVGLPLAPGVNFADATVREAAERRRDLAAVTDTVDIVLETLFRIWAAASKLEGFLLCGVLPFFFFFSLWVFSLSGLGFLFLFFLVQNLGILFFGHKIWGFQLLGFCFNTLKSICSSWTLAAFYSLLDTDTKKKKDIKKKSKLMI